MVQFSPQQQGCLAAMSDWYCNSDDKHCVIHGYAGSGKTTLLTSFARKHPDLQICAPTGKAASVLAMKSGFAATTIHSIFYVLVDKGKDEQTGRQILYFKKKNPEGSLIGKTVLLDECSMVNVQMAHDLLISGARIMAFGDPAQLPPIFGNQAFPEPDYLLTEVHRQAQESAVIRQATAIRATGMYQDDGEDFRVVPYLSDDDLLSADVALCYRNVTRHQMNKRIRKLKNFSGDPKRGELVMCLKNAKQYGLYNGGVYTLAQDVAIDPNGHPTSVSLLIDGAQVDVPGAGFVESGGAIGDFDDDIITAFDFGYVLTAHKAQGSEWDRVAIFDECKRRDVRKSWLYTACSRAAKSIIIQR